MAHDSLRDLKVGAWAGKKFLVSLGILGLGEKALQRVSVSLGDHLSCGSWAPRLGEPTSCTSRGERQGGASSVPTDREMEKEARRRVAKDSGERMGPEVGEGPGRTTAHPSKPPSAQGAPSSTLLSSRDHQGDGCN